MNKTAMWVLVVIALLVGLFAGYYYEKTKMDNLMASTVAGMQKQVDDAKASNKTMPTEMMMKSDTTMMSDGVLKASNGMTLYTYDKDTKGVSNCTGACATAWPPYTVSGTAPSPMPAHLGTITRADGSTQYTWDGMPLYYYVKDKDSGDTYGDGVGGVWHVVK